MDYAVDVIRVWGWAVGEEGGDSVVEFRSDDGPQGNKVDGGGFEEERAEEHEDFGAGCSGRGRCCCCGH